jgi:hypothetical protein
MVKALFSISMFNWQASSPNDSSINTGSGEKVVATNFWIYWVVSVPVTLAVMVGWRIWWHYQKSYYMRMYPHAKQDEESHVATL